MDPPPRSNRNSPERSENVADPSENDADAAEDSNSSKSSDGEDSSKIIRVVSENSKEMERESSGASKPRKSRKSIGPFFKLPVIFTYPAKNRPKQPFMTQVGPQPGAQPGAQPVMSSRSQPPIRPVLRQSSLFPSRTAPPPPPPYYSDQVTEENHQPQQLVGGQNSDRHRIRSVSFQGPDVHQDHPPTGQLAIMPNALSNIAYWAPYPEQIPTNIPACLAHLVAADCLFIVQQLDVIELFISVDEPNFYLIQNKEGQCVYYAYETSDICGQVCCTHSRGFQIHVMDMYHNEIIYMNRPCGFNNFFCCYPVLEVYSPPLVPVGAIQKVSHPTHQEFVILDADENKMFKIHGPCALRTCSCCVEAEFTIHALDSEETEVGVIRREWGGLIRTYFTNADYYGITFPIDLDVRIKAVFLGALFFIDYTFYEDT